MRTSTSSLRLWVGTPVDDTVDDPSAKSKPGIHRLRVRLRNAVQWIMSDASGARRGRPVVLGVLLVLLVLVLAGVVLQVSSYLRARGNADRDRYAVYIDGGSSGTRVRVFHYRSRRWPSYVALSLPEPSFAVEPGLSAYANAPQRAADSLDPLLAFSYQHVPGHLWHVTPVRLLATAGLRLLTAQQQEAVLEACRARLASSRFLFQPAWAAVIGGEMEGLYGWAAVNYVTGALQEAAGHAHHSRREMLDASQLFTGLLEMGGASMQLTFLPHAAEQLPEKHGGQLHLPGVPSRLYAHSYLGLGMDSALEAAEERVAAHVPQEQRGNGEAWLPHGDPCLPIGYRGEDGRVGNASLSGCMAVIQKVLPPVRCTTASSEEDTLAAAASARRGSGWESSTGGDLVGSEAGLGAATREADAGSSSSGRSLMALHGAKEGDAHTADSAHVHNPDEAAAHFAGGSSGNGGGSSASTGRKSRRKRVETGAATEDGGSAGAGHSGDGAGSSGLHCTLLGAFLPTLHGRFVAVENFAWTASALGLPEGATLRQLRDVGEDFCARHWSVLHAQYSSHIPDQYLSRYCFGAAYILVLLHERLGIGLDERRVTWTNTLTEPSSGAQVSHSWVLGAAVVDAMSGDATGARRHDAHRLWGREYEQDPGEYIGVAALSGTEAAMAAGARLALLVPLLALAVLLVGLLVAVAGGGKAGLLARMGGWLKLSAAAAAAGSVAPAAATVKGRAWGAGSRLNGVQAVAGAGMAPGRPYTPPASLNSEATAWSSSRLVSMGVAMGAQRAASSLPEGEADGGVGVGAGVMLNGGQADGLWNPALLKTIAAGAHTLAIRRAPSFTSVYMPGLDHGGAGVSGVPHGGVTPHEVADGSSGGGGSSGARIRTD